MKVEIKDNLTLSIVPETEFEAEFLGKMFFATEDRKVIVKSGMSVVDLQSIDIKVTKKTVPPLSVKCPVDGKDVVHYPAGSIGSMIKQLQKDIVGRA